MSRTIRKKIFQEHEKLQRKTQGLMDELKNTDLIQNVFADCQNMAVAIGSQIEMAYAEGLACIHGLEDYCETIYQAAVEQSTQKKRRLLERAEEILELVKQRMQQEIPDKLEVVFLPYKASMWDSLESIWFAAEEDISCDAYVIPIPYYDKDSDGNLKEEHYEGKEYPDYVPITDYKTYDFETRRPDIIFIHNPYDAGNHVTSVHPFFYSKNLKQFTEKLVYVPYFVLDGNGIPENYAFTSAAIHADYIIVQNETEKEDYIRYFKENAPDFPIADKLLPLGSPKFDKVRSLNRENVNAPKEWLERSKDKKVILYNTSLNAMLENSEAYMQKLKDVFSFFENREDAILLWRPHPLMESSISSMRPELYEDYMGLKKEFLEKNIGIYDDTPDMYTAIGLSDAYYGDRSSVLQLYQETGKISMIQNVEVRNKMEKMPVWPSEFWVDDNDIWFVHGKVNVLMRYDMLEKETKVIGVIPNEKMIQEILYSDIYMYHEKVFLIPCWGRKIAVYDKREEKFTEIEIKNIENYHGKSLFCRAFRFEKYLYCIPHYYDAIIKINMENLKIEYVEKDIIQCKKQVEVQTYINDAVQVDERRVLAVYSDTNKILKFDMFTEKAEIVQIGNSENCYKSLCYIQDELYLYDIKREDIVKCSINKKNQPCFLHIKGLDKVKISAFGKREILADFSYENKFLVLDSYGNIIYQECGKILRNKNRLNYDYYHGRIKNNIGADNKTFYFNCANNKMCIFIDGELKDVFSMSIYDEEITKLQREMIEYENTLLEENNIITLQVWLNEMKCKEKITTYGEKKGKRIWTILENDILNS